MRATALFLALLMVLSPAASAADLCASSALLMQGAKAPCEGVLIPRAEFAELKRLREVALPRAELMLKMNEELYGEKILLWAERVTVRDNTITGYRQLIDKWNSPVELSWYRDPAFTWPAGIVVGALIAVSAYYGVQAAAK